MKNNVKLKILITFYSQKDSTIKNCKYHLLYYSEPSFLNYIFLFPASIVFFYVNSFANGKGYGAVYREDYFKRSLNAIRG